MTDAKKPHEFGVINESGTLDIIDAVYEFGWSSGVSVTVHGWRKPSDPARFELRTEEAKRLGKQLTKWARQQERAAFRRRMTSVFRGSAP